ncbi:MAG: S-layer homology domain-containing protein [Clostridia bacterium]|nr:S-layer homology domain-containing protein [Clostridia bacterium]
MKFENAGNALLRLVITAGISSLMLIFAGMGFSQVYAEESAGTAAAQNVTQGVATTQKSTQSAVTDRNYTQNDAQTGAQTGEQTDAASETQKAAAEADAGTGADAKTDANAEDKADADSEGDAGAKAGSGAEKFDLSCFVDLSPNYWARENIAYVCGKGLMKGAYFDRFMPKKTFSRGMAVTVLYRMAGSPPVDTAAAIELRSEPVYSSPAKNDKPDVDATVAGFTDVNPFWYYTEPVIWAQNAGIIYSDKTDRFSSERPISRAELASLLYYFARHSGYDVEAATNNGVLRIFADADSIADWSVRPLSYMVSVGILAGDNKGCINPSGSATRAEVAAMLHRFAENAPSYTTQYPEKSDAEENGGSAEESDGSADAQETAGNSASQGN